MLPNWTSAMLYCMAFQLTHLNLRRWTRTLYVGTLIRKKGPTSHPSRSQPNCSLLNQIQGFGIGFQNGYWNCTPTSIHKLSAWTSKAWWLLHNIILKTIWHLQIYEWTVHFKIFYQHLLTSAWNITMLVIIFVKSTISKSTFQLITL